MTDPAIPGVSNGPRPPRAWVSIGSADLTAEIDPLGAQLSALRDRNGRDLLWDGEPSIWAGRAPLLFPIVGALAGGSYRLGAHRHALSRHGFARGSAFRLVDSTAGSALLRLTADEATRQAYPFPFQLDVGFVIDGATLTIMTTLGNPGDGALPASFGYHPAFRWPLPFGQARSAHDILFPLDEPAPIRRLDTQGLLIAERFATPVTGRRLALCDALFEPDVVIFDELRSRSITYGAAAGPRIRVGFPNAPYLGVWTKPDAPFICIEPWFGIADPEGYTGDFGAKPGVFSIAPGGARMMPMTITLLT